MCFHLDLKPTDSVPYPPTSPPEGEGGSSSGSVLSLFAAADEMSGDWSEFVSTVLWDSDVVDGEFYGVGGAVLLVDAVILRPEMRGYGLGPLLLAETLAVMSRGCADAFLMSVPIVGDHTEEERARIGRKLERTWERAGFCKYRDGYMALDLGARHHLDCLGALRREFDIH